MLWIALAVAAAQISAPEPLNLEKWFSNEDVPDYLMQRSSGIWEVGIRLNVRPDGTIRDCRVESPSDIPDLDVLSCGLAFHRAKFHAAHWSDGSPAYGVYRDSIEWSVGDATALAPFASNPDVDVFVQSLPHGIKSALVRVMFAVDPLGSKSSCIADPHPSLEKTTDDPVLVSIACEQIAQGYKATPAKDSSGKAVPSVQNALVRFSVKKQ